MMKVLTILNMKKNNLELFGRYRTTKPDAQIPTHMRVYPKVYGLAARSENCKSYSSLLIDAVVLLFCESV